MIAIAGSTINPDELISQYPRNSVETQILKLMASSTEIYNYASLEHLKFELNLRKNIVDSSIALNRSHLAFRVFRDSFCNEKYWSRTDEGGFLLLSNVRASEAIRDIYRSSYLYGTECATAMVILFYKAVEEIFPTELFDRVFSRIYLMDWQHLDRNLGIISLREAKDYFPGDCRYIRNPDVDPLTPQWQGENIIDLGSNLYYGHGIGITTIDKFIEALNANRRSGATISAYLMDQVIRLDSNYLFGLYQSYSPRFYF